jgi:small-conductance mechanosensitive channel
MPPRIYTITSPTNPVLQVLYFLVGGLLLIGAVLIGAVILAVALGLALIVGVIVYARIWWLKRKFARSGSAGARRREGTGQETLEVEYTVVRERDEPDDR